MKHAECLISNENTLSYKHKMEGKQHYNGNFNLGRQRAVHDEKHGNVSPCCNLSRSSLAAMGALSAYGDKIIAKL